MLVVGPSPSFVSELTIELRISIASLAFWTCEAVMELGRLAIATRGGGQRLTTQLFTNGNIIGFKGQTQCRIAPTPQPKIDRPLDLFFKFRPPGHSTMKSFPNIDR